MEVLNLKKFKVTDEMLASKTKRFVNFIIDRMFFHGVVLVLIFLIVIITQLIGYEGMIVSVDDLEHINPFLDQFITLLLIIICYIILEGLSQKTIGKLITRTIVVTENGEKPEIGLIIKRSFCRLIPFNALSFLGSDAKGWHDSISKTYVVDIKKFEDQKLAHFNFHSLGKE